MGAVTAKVVCNTKTEMGEGDDAQATVTFMADYADERNKEWARYTPALSLSMTLRGAVGERFTKGGKYTLTFTEDDAASVE